MQRVTMTYEMPEDHFEFMDAYNGWRWKLLVQEFDEWLRQQIKYQDKEHLQEARDKLHELLDTSGLRIWD